MSGTERNQTVPIDGGTERQLILFVFGGEKEKKIGISYETGKSNILCKFSNCHMQTKHLEHEIMMFNE
jgi:hypothetical protein